MAEEDQRAAREADVAGGDRREAERGEGSNDSRHEQMDSCICSEGIRFLEAAQSPRAQSRDEVLGGTGEGHTVQHRCEHRSPPVQCRCRACNYKLDRGPGFARLARIPGDMVYGPRKMG